MRPAGDQPGSRPPCRDRAPPRSTIWKVLARHRLSRRRRGQRRSYRRYEWSRPGALLNMDVQCLARFSVPGHRVTGDRRTNDLHRGIGYDHLHCVVDDHSRLAYVERHPREDAETNARTLERALLFFAELGLEPLEALMTDNAMVYRSGTGRRSAAFTTSVGSTARRSGRGGCPRASRSPRCRPS